MKVYLIKTPEVELETLEAVSDFLASFDGPMEFSFSDKEFNKEQFPFLIYDETNWPTFEEPELDVDNLDFTLHKMKADRKNSHFYHTVYFEDLFSICEFYREKFCEPDSFVVLLTKYQNEYSYLSSFSSKNIFVNVDHWNKFTQDTDAKYPIAYEVAQNIMSSLMNIDYDQDKFMKFYQKQEKKLWHKKEDLDKVLTNYNPYIHFVPRGCMNDFCGHKKDVILKLQTGNICSTCLAKTFEENIDSRLLKQVISIFNAIRSEFMFQTEEQIRDSLRTGDTAQPFPLIIERTNKIYIKTKTQMLEVRLNPLCKMFYLFLLKKEDGVRVKELIDYKDELTKLYLKIRPGRELEKATKSIDDLVSQKEDTSFNSLRSIINKTIDELLRKTGLANHYTINGERGEAYGVKIPRNLIEYRF